MEALIAATKITEDLERILDEGDWFEHEMLCRERTVKFLQLLFFLNSLDPEQRKATLTLDFSPTEDLHTFMKKLRIKIEEKDLDSKQTIAKTINAIHTAKSASADCSLDTTSVSEEPHSPESSMTRTIASVGMDQTIDYLILDLPRIWAHLQWRPWPRDSRTLLTLRIFF